MIPTDRLLFSCVSDTGSDTGFCIRREERLCVLPSTDFTDLQGHLDLAASAAVFCSGDNSSGDACVMDMQSPCTVAGMMGEHAEPWLSHWEPIDYIPAATLKPPDLALKSHPPSLHIPCAARGTVFSAPASFALAAEEVTAAAALDEDIMDLFDFGHDEW